MKAAAAVLAVLATSAQAEFISGNDLLRRLNSEQADRTVAVAYIAGVWDAMQGITICAPNTVELSQVVEMTHRALIALPQIRDKSGDAFVVAVASKQWPCAKRATGPNA